MTTISLPPLDLTEMSTAERVALLNPHEQERALEELSEADLSSDEFWLRRSQMRAMLDIAWLVVMLSGRGGGKTKVGARWVNRKARTPGTRLHLIGRTVGDVRDVMVQGESGVLAESEPEFVPEYHPSLRKLVWPNGSLATTFSSEIPSQLRGPQAHASWCDELATWRQVPDDSGATAWDQVQIGTRLGDQPQIFVTTTPKRHKVIRDLMDRSHVDPRISMHFGSTLENRANLSIEYLSTLLAMYSGTALERQEIYGELIDIIEGAMWRPTDFAYGYPSPEERTLRVVAVDPGVTTGGDATGIVAVRATTVRPLHKRRAWVMADYTDPALGPDRWPVRVVDAWREHDAAEHGERCIVVAEKNQGGELVSSAIAQVDPTCPVALIHAKGSKASRAEPCVLAYRQDRIRHATELTELQDELTSWEPDSKWSPNRLDAMVHGLRALLVDDTPLRRFVGATWGTAALSAQLPAAVPQYRRERETGGSAGRGAFHVRDRDR